MSYKDKLFDLIYDKHKSINWERDERSNCSDYECDFGSLKLRLVSNRDGDYLQVLRTCADYRFYDATDYPKVREMLDNVHNEWIAERDEKFFSEVYHKLNTALGKIEGY